MTSAILLATNHGLVTCHRGADGWQPAAIALGGQDVTGVIAREGVILAGTTQGVFRSDDGGQSWQAVSDGPHSPHIRWLAYHPDISDREYAGTEPAGIFISHDGAGSWRSCPEVEALRDHFHWFLPYSPEAGCVRGFAFHGERIYAAVEVGGVLRSDDCGEAWQLAGGSSGRPDFDIPPGPQVHADVHSVASHPSSPDLVFAATGEGLYRSGDGGDTWTVSQRGFYCRAVWIDPADSDHIILGPADSVARKNGRIEESHDGGATWRLATDGLDLPWPDRMVERFTVVDDELFAVTSDGCTYVTPLESLHWQRIFTEISGANLVAPVNP